MFGTNVKNILFQLNDTVTAGIVSTPHRGLNLGRQKADIKYIQTDAVITVSSK